ncbi:sterol regulatory element-binding protein 1 [Platysternon megacephalum]|uniref:Sterol regulatory element-binding protein 1 n=1 Tax=Platysternon megacephalum TaxID=55544 RepID=A0A4D9EJG5_9SAUR|nr:sterol regulatory element-binding protein 1 [Platysternon megacephalum]
MRGCKRGEVAGSPQQRLVFLGHGCSLPAPLNSPGQVSGLNTPPFRPHAHHCSTQAMDPGRGIQISVQLRLPIHAKTLKYLALPNLSQSRVAFKMISCRGPWVHLLLYPLLSLALFQNLAASQPVAMEIPVMLQAQDCGAGIE